MINEEAEKRNKVSTDFDEEQQKQQKLMERYEQLRDDAVYALSFYAREYSNIVDEPDEEHEKASRSLRDIGVKFEVLAANNLQASPKMPNKQELKEVSGQFIGLSNSMYVYKGGDTWRLLDDNTKREERIKDILKLP